MPAARTFQILGLATLLLVAAFLDERLAWAALALDWLVVVAFLIWKIEDFNPFVTKGQRLDAVFPTVAGLDDKASVRIAGVKVGHVDGVGLQGTQARI